MIPLQIYTVNNLHPFTTYSFRVRGANLDNGTMLWGDFNESLLFTTDSAGN